MSHRIYTTLGFIVESRPYGEAGKILSIFTRELGMVNVAAQGIRLSPSKLRYHSQDGSLAEFSLVRGRDLWRLVGAEKNVPKDQPALLNISTFSNSHDPLFIRTLAVLRRLIHGEEKNETLFEAVLAVHAFLGKNNKDKNNKDKNKDEKAILISLAEPVIILRILHHLGYVRTKPEFEIFLADNSFSVEILEKMSVPGIKSSVIKEINKALEESHL
jgi:recombinational DNA repair protein (RecF pathway)